MKKKKLSKGWELFLLLNLAFFTGLSLGVIVVDTNYALQGNSDFCVAIPNDDMIDNFCEEKGFKFGWLSSDSCDINQVMCYKETNGGKYYECVDFVRG